MPDMIVHRWAYWACSTCGKCGVEVAGVLSGEGVGRERGRQRERKARERGDGGTRRAGAQRKKLGYKVATAAGTPAAGTIYLSLSYRGTTYGI
jgi:hypothetical protein